MTRIDLAEVNLIKETKHVLEGNSYGWRGVGAGQLFGSY
jgi:hypothetical protein